MKHIGIVGISAEGAALCYREICRLATLRNLPSPHRITLDQADFEAIQIAQSKADWEEVAQLLLSSIEILKRAGADFAILPANSVHFAIPFLQTQSPIPVLNLVDLVTQHCESRHWKKVGIMGVGYTLRHGLYDPYFERAGILPIYPSPAQQKEMNRIIYDELVPGAWTNDSVKALIGISSSLEDAGVEAIVLGCTELPLVLKENDRSLPFVDTTAHLAKAAFNHALF